MLYLLENILSKRKKNTYGEGMTVLFAPSTEGFRAVTQTLVLHFFVV